MDELNQQQTVETAPEAVEQTQEVMDTSSVENVAEQTQEEHKPKGVQKRIDELVRQREDERRRADRLEQMLEQAISAVKTPQQEQPQPRDTDARPDPQHYANYDDYIVELGQWGARQEAKALHSKTLEQARLAKEQSEHAQRVEAFNAKAQEVVGKYTDFADVAFDKTVPITDVMADAILTSDVGPEVSYFLGKNRDEAARISRLNPIQQVREIAKIETRIAAGAPSKTTAAPPPPSTVGGSTPGTHKDPSQMSMAEFVKWREQSNKPR